MNRCSKCNQENSRDAHFCRSCGARLRKAGLEDKRARLTTAKRRLPVLPVTVAVVLLLVAAAAAALVLAPRGADTTSRVAVRADSGNGDAPLVFPASIFDDGTARRYRHELPSGKQVSFFILKSPDGVIRSAFDACDVCFPARKGYRQEGNTMVCNNCGQVFESSLINVVKGGCNPSPLPNRLENGSVIIALSDLMTGSRYF